MNDLVYITVSLCATPLLYRVPLYHGWGVQAAKGCEVSAYEQVPVVPHLPLLQPDGPVPAGVYRSTRVRGAGIVTRPLPQTCNTHIHTEGTEGGGCEMRDAGCECV